MTKSVVSTSVVVVKVDAVEGWDWSEDRKKVSCSLTAAVGARGEGGLDRIPRRMS